MKFVSYLAVPLIAAMAAASPADERDAPIYRITVVQRSLPAVNYGQRSGPTKVDFHGTVLAPETRGSATVEAKAGAVIIHAKLAGLDAPAKFGPQYLTYVLWAISPEGQTERLGEVITNHKDDAKLEVTTSLQTFGLLVTAEPYFAVSKPGPVVVMENVLRPDTIGASEPVSAKYELLPRAETYTVNLQPAGTASRNRPHGLAARIRSGAGDLPGAQCHSNRQVRRRRRKSAGNPGEGRAPGAASGADPRSQEQ